MNWVSLHEQRGWMSSPERTAAYAKMMKKISTGSVDKTGRLGAAELDNWVQCENPECQKWRKIPWHVDIDMLSKKFVCSDHIWGLNPPSCDAPEEDWDETTDACVEADGSVKPNDGDNIVPTKKNVENNQAPHTSCSAIEFKVGGTYLNVC